MLGWLLTAVLLLVAANYLHLRARPRKSLAGKIVSFRVIPCCNQRMTVPICCVARF